MSDPSKIVPSRCGIPTPTVKKLSTGHPTHHPNDIISVRTLNFCCYYLCTVNWTNLPYLNVINVHRCMH